MPSRRSRGLKMLLIGVAVLGVGWLAPSGAAQTSVTERDISGAIIATQEDRVSVSSGDTVLLDQGRLAGVEIGDRYVVFQDARSVIHPYSGRTLHIPRETIGELRVVDVHERTSKALVVRSTREVNVGALVAALHTTRQQEGRLDDTGWRTQAQARLGQLAPCLEATRQAVRSADQTRSPGGELLEAQSALTRAEQAFEQAQALVMAGEHERAAHRLDTAIVDCLRAEGLMRSLAGMPGRREGEPAARYAVRRGDTLWGISGQEQIYRNPLMWPLIYKANSQQIRDPDRIFPQQIFVVPRQYTSEEAAAAMQQARQRSVWRLGDAR